MSKMSASSPVQQLRELIRERLTAAAEEIFSLVQRTIVQYEEETQRQWRPLDGGFQRAGQEIRLDGTDLPLSKKKVEPAAQQLWNQEGASSVGQPHWAAEPPHIKEEDDELCEEQLVLKQDAEIAMATSAPHNVSVAEPDKDQLHSGNFSDLVGSWNPESNSARDPELNPEKNRIRTGSLAGFWSHPEEFRPVLKQEADELTSPEEPSGTLLIPVGAELGGSGTVQSWVSRRSGGPRNPGLEPRLRPVSCDVCGKAFRCNSEMRVHYRVHTGEQPFSCGVCQRAFSFKVNLSVHMRTHTGERPYCCQFCQRRFSDHSSLRKHIYIHTGERPYSCAVCGKRFSRNSHRWRHVRLHAAAAPPT